MVGFLNIHKPAGMTSHDVVARVRRLAGRGVKVGHAGTLDPAATGVLPLALGAATRLIPYLVDTRKGYRAVVRLGQTTTTDDAEGEPQAQRPVPPLDRANLEAMLAPFRGEIMQVPPMYAAIHHQGRKLYELAREGQTVERAPRPITIDQLDLLALDTENAALELRVGCSKGTYIRALARDIGAALGCGAHLAALERTFVGPFHVDEATALATLLDDPARLPALLLPPEIVVAHWPMVTLDEAQTRRVQHGNMLTLPQMEATAAGPQVRAHAADGKLLALLERREDGWQPVKVFG
jgi:tRNA pseudouridine55 synthase